jgi:DNA polymerase-3 subunit epsilon
MADLIEANEFAVVDVETTGLSPDRSDRVIEIGVVRIDGKGRLRREYETLINPGRSVGPTWVHGITDSQVSEAPAFEAIAWEVVSILSGAVFVAHNVSFDRRFLLAELGRAGVPAPPLVELCTVRLGRQADPQTPSAKLETLCSRFKISRGLAHSAGDDARATAQLLVECIRRLGASTLADLGIATPPPPAPARQERICWAAPVLRPGIARGGAPALT